ncbi:putative nucleoredoxin 1-1 [Silene latifolia]|uniref:putative nucleoredoxin 1-1 n=1 Tax=Silene latifolia TaxID=37657 RepID=UPI003D77A22E
MYFPSSTDIISKNQRISPKEEEEEETAYVSEEDHIRITYGDNIRLRKIYGESYLRKIYGYNELVDSGKGKGNIIIKSGGSKRNEPKRKTIKIVKGEKLKCGIRRFLSNNGKTSHLVRFEEGVLQDEPVEFDSLSGKYLLICCFHIPMLCGSSIAQQCRSLIDAYNELSELGYPFEMVVVAILRTDIVYDLKAAFDHFYSAFSCLAIPFSDFETRDYIHSCMRGGTHLDLESAILVDPQGIVLEGGEAPDHFLYFGSEWAPSFLPTTLDAIRIQDNVLRCRLDPMNSPRTFLYKLNPMYAKKYGIDDVVDEVCQEPLSLHGDILLCDPLFTLHRFDAASETDDELSSTVLDLSRKYVGLYLFINGDIMKDIKAAHDHCLANNQQLEIMLVPMPFWDEPETHIKQLHEALRSLNIKSWFLYSCPNGVCRKLWRIFGRGFPWPGEKFIIIPPDCKSGELCGREVLINLGVDQYPFTRTAILQQRLEYVRSLIPIFSTLFNNCPMIQNGQEFNSEQLKGKNVLLYLTWSQCDGYKRVKKHYPKIKAMGWEVVFVLLDYEHRRWNKEWVDEPMGDPISCHKCPCFNLKQMPWPCYMLPTAEAKASIKKQLFFPEDEKAVYLFAVGKDGKIVSRDVEHRLHTDGVTESLFDDVLECDLALVLATIPLYNDFY